jgi:hypothetical protein
MLALLFGLLMVPTAEAANEMPFVDAKALFATLANNFDSELARARTSYAQTLGGLEAQITAKQQDKLACPDVSCARRIQSEIDVLENQKRPLKDRALAEEMRIKNRFDRNSKEIALASFSYELKSMARAHVEIMNFTDRTDGPCQSAQSAQFGYTHPSEHMFCRQLNLEYRYGQKFYSLKFAVGLQVMSPVYDHRSGWLSDSGADSIKAVFSQSTEEFMSGMSPGYHFGFDRRYRTGRQNWVNVSPGQTYKMYNPATVGFHYVGIDEI